MSKGRSAPPLDPKEQARRAALASLDVRAIRAWLTAYGMGASDDDALVLRAAHEARADDWRSSRRQRAESRAWLMAHAPDSISLLSDKQIAERMR